ncbi:hypothetical protein [Natronomonas sp. EA1]
MTRDSTTETEPTDTPTTPETTESPEDRRLIPLQRQHGPQPKRLT